MGKCNVITYSVATLHSCSMRDYTVRTECYSLQPAWDSVIKKRTDIMCTEHTCYLRFVAPIVAAVHSLKYEDDRANHHHQHCNAYGHQIFYSVMFNLKHCHVIVRFQTLNCQVWICSLLRISVTGTHHATSERFVMSQQ